MLHFERRNTSENNNFNTEIEQIIAPYKADISERLSSVAKKLELHYDRSVLDGFKEIEIVINRNNEAALITLRKALEKSFSLHGPLKEKSIASAVMVYEITNKGNLLNLNLFLNKHNIVSS